MEENSFKTVYQFKLNLIDGTEKKLSDFRGKVLLIVNTASDCGFTPQFKDLQLLYDEFAKDGFEILAVPSNDFGHQEPLSNSEIISFCKDTFQVKFPLFQKTLIRGNLAHPLYKFLSDKKENGKLSSSPKWNFHKYLINKKGEVVDYFYSFTKPNSSKIRKSILRLLQEN